MKIESDEIPYIICLIAYQAGKYLLESLGKFEDDLLDVTFDYDIIKGHLKNTIRDIESYL